jgi:hypothetical protein
MVPIVTACEIPEAQEMEDAELAEEGRVRVGEKIKLRTLTEVLLSELTNFEKACRNHNIE